MGRKAEAFDGEADKLSYLCVSERKCNINGKSRRNHTLSAGQRSETGGEAGERDRLADTGADG